MDKTKVKRNGKKFSKKKLIIWIICIAVLLVVGFFIFKFFFNKNEDVGMMQETYTTDVVTKQDIVSNLNTTGTLKPANSYDVTSLVNGKILSANFEEGQIVDADTVLYNVDDTEAKSALEKAKNAYAQEEKNYNKLVAKLNDLNISAEKSGTIIEVDISEGDDITEGQVVAHIRDNSIMCLTVPFISDDVDNFKVGQAANVVLDDSFETLSGTITKIKNVEEAIEGYRVVRQVTIDVKNPGGIAPTTKATANVGDTACVSSGVFTYKTELEVKSSVSGTVQKLNIAEGDKVQAGQILATLDSDELKESIESSSNALANAKLNVDDMEAKLSEYTIKSPIHGTIIEKKYKEGDKFDGGQTMCTIFDLSYMQFTANIDEIDITKIQVGQNVSITVDALNNSAFEGVITKINVNGNTESGSTMFPVTVRIDETEGLLPGMNVNAVIELASKTDAICVPISAVQRGNRVLVKNDYVDVNDTENVTPSEFDGYSYVNVELGINDTNFVEITSGLNEGDEIAIVDGMGIDLNHNDDMSVDGVYMGF